MKVGVTRFYMRLTGHKKTIYVIVLLLSVGVFVLSSNLVIDIYYLKTAKNDYVLYGENMRIIADYLLLEEYPVIVVNKRYILPSASNKTINSEETQKVEKMEQWTELSDVGYYEVLKDNGGIYFIRHKGMYGIYGIMYYPNGFEPIYDQTIIKKEELSHNWYCFVSQ